MRLSLHELLDPKILIVLSLLGILMISLLYPASVHQFSREYREDLPLGSFVWIEGKVEEFRVIEGNIILRISGYPQVFIPEEVASKISIKKGDFVRISGVLKLYRGAREIEVVSPSDVSVLSE